MKSANKVSHIAKLIELIMVLSPSTNACERGFSRMIIMKTKNRCSLNHDNFKDQLMMKLWLSWGTRHDISRDTDYQAQK